MAWIEPKTNWAKQEYFNLNPDYGRIKDNVVFIRDLYNSLYDDTITPLWFDDYELGSFPNHTNFNRLCLNIEEIMFKLTGKTQWSYYNTFYNGYFRRLSQESKVWDYIELNEIESTILQAYTIMNSLQKHKLKLPVKIGATLGGGLINGV